MTRPKGKGSNAKQRIMAEAMALFATKGYAATTMKDIAAAVGIKDASIYNHFKSKRDLFEAIVETELAYLAETLRDSGAMAAPGDSKELYRTTDVSALIPVVLRSFKPLFDDKRIVCLRKMLESNRYEDERCGELFNRIFIERPVAIEEAIFQDLIDGGILSTCDSRLAAMEFYGSIFMLLIADARWDEAAEHIEARLREFIRLRSENRR